MGCGCGVQANTDLRISSKGETYQDLTGKMVLDKSGNQLLIIDAIFDAYKDIIGYTVKNLEQKTLRIFAKDIAQILD